MQVSPRVIIGIISSCVALTGIIVANMILMAVIGEINRRREAGKSFSYFGFTFIKLLRIFREYRNLYPNGYLYIYAWMSFAVAIVGLIIVGVCIGIFD